MEAGGRSEADANSGATISRALLLVEDDEVMPIREVEAMGRSEKGTAGANLLVIQSISRFAKFSTVLPIF